MAEYRRPPQVPNFAGANMLMARASEQIGQGLGQGVQAFGNLNTALTAQATRKGQDLIRGLGSREQLAATPFEQIQSQAPSYANQDLLRQAYETQGKPVEADAYKADF